MLAKLQLIASKAKQYQDKLTNEEVTKTALILPFISALGYDVTNPFEVVPEYHADFADIKADKVDLCIMVDDKPTVMIECKKYASALDKKHKSQLAKYFHFLPTVKIAILTNGKDFEVYSDLKDQNKMDEEPLLRFNIDQISEPDVAMLAYLTKEQFSIENIVDRAIKSNATSIILSYLKDNFDNPSDEYLTFVLKQVLENLPSHPAIVNQKTKDLYKQNVIEAHQKLINSTISHRLQAVIQPEQQAAIEQLPIKVTDLEPTKSSAVITTEEESYGFNIIRAILGELVEPERIFMRDALSYCAVLFDDNNRKPIVRLHFNAKTTKYVEIFSDKDISEKITIIKVTDIFKHAIQIKNAVSKYLVS